MFYLGNSRSTRFFYKQRFFFRSASVLLNFSRIDRQMLLRCCLIHKSIIILRHFLYLLYLCPCLFLGLFLSYLCDLFFIVIFFFMMITCIISRIQTYIFFCLFFRVCPIIFGWQCGWRMWTTFKFQKLSPRVLLSSCLIYCQFQPDIAYKSFAYKKSEYCNHLYNALSWKIFFTSISWQTGVIKKILQRISFAYSYNFAQVFQKKLFLSSVWLCLEFRKIKTTRVWNTFKDSIFNVFSFSSYQLCLSNKAHFPTHVISRS